MKRLIIVGLLLTPFGIYAEDAKTEGATPKERRERCLVILRELFPAEIRTDLNYLATLADEGLLSKEQTESLDSTGRSFRTLQLLSAKTYHMLDDLFGDKPTGSVKEADVDSAFKEMHRLGTNCKADVRILKEHLSVVSMLQAADQLLATPKEESGLPSDPNDRKLFLDIIAPSIQNRLSLIFHKHIEVLTAAESNMLPMACTRLVQETRLAIRLMHEDHAGKPADRALRDALIEQIAGDEKVLSSIPTRFPTAKRWAEWEK